MSETEIQLLRKELRALQTQVAHLQIRVAELEGFEVVSGVGDYEGYPPQPEETGSASASASPSVPVTSSTPSPAGPVVEEASEGQSSACLLPGR